MRRVVSARLVERDSEEDLGGTSLPVAGKDSVPKFHSRRTQPGVHNPARIRIPTVDLGMLSLLAHHSCLCGHVSVLCGGLQGSHRRSIWQSLSRWRR